MCPFSILAFLQPTTVDKEPKKEADTNVSASFLMIYESMKTTYSVSKSAVTVFVTLFLKIG